jgi:2-phospho-L-lactate guanylyltransferase
VQRHLPEPPKHPSPNGIDDRAPHEPPRVAAVLPFRGLDDAKSRLAPALDADARRDLALDLLDRAVDALRVAGVERIAVVTLDPRLVELPIAARAEVLVQPGRGLNAAIRQGQRWARAAGVDALLVVLPDLPLLEPDDVRALLAAARPESAVIAPDRHGAGTNALLLAPPDAIRPAFGAASAPRHRLALALADIPVTDVQRPGLQLDLDTTADIEALGEFGLRDPIVSRPA